MTLSTMRICVGVPMPVVSIIICIAGVSPVMSITPGTGTLCPDTSMVIEKRAVVIVCVAAWTIARNVALSTGSLVRLGDELGVAGVLLLGPASGSVAVVRLESLPHAASEERASGRAATRAA